MSNPGDPGHALLAQLARGLVRHGEEQTHRSLGDRSAYVGMSDIGKAIDCLRAAVANKVVPHPPADPALDLDLDELAGLKGQRSALDDEIEEREERIRRFCHLSGDRSQWQKTDLFRFRNARVPGRKTVDPNKLRSALEAHLDDPTIDAVLAAATNIGADYERLSVTKQNPGR